MAEPLAYLESLQGVELHRLYRSPPSALAVFRRILSGLAKHFVMNMLYSPRPTPLTEFELMVKASKTKERHEAIDQLHRYHIVKDVALRTGKAIALVPDFARSLRQVLGGGGTGYSFGKVVEPSELDAMSIEELDDYARLQWEGILGFMVGTSILAELQEPGDELPPPPQSVIDLLKAGQLIAVRGTASRGQSGSVTKEGFSFVLKNVNTQVWQLLFLYVDHAEDFEMEKIDVLSFIFFISSLELGLAYSTASLSEKQHMMLAHLLGMGIVYQSEASSTFFYPTRLATTLTSSNSTALSSASQTLGSSLQANSALSAAHSTSPSAAPGSGFIIIETNFRLYAYTTSPLQIALLSLFIALRSRHPNMVTGKLTKASVQRAIQQGITAEQIRTYLTTHAHPQMRKTAMIDYAQELARKQAIASVDEFDPTQNQETNFSVVPKTIMDQITLWQKERDRIKSTLGFLLKDFESFLLYSDAVKYADETGVLIWKNDKQRTFFVTRFEGVQTFIKEKKERAAALAG